MLEECERKVGGRFDGWGKEGRDWGDLGFEGMGE